MSLQNECLSSGESEPEEATDEDLTGASNLFPKEIYYNPYINFEEITYDSHFFPSVKDFVGQARILENIPLNSTDPCDYFEYFFDATLFQNIIIQTNLYREQVSYMKSDNMKDWEPVPEGELRKFIGLSINMEHVRKGDIKDYCSTDFALSTPVFGYVMSRDWSIQILRSLHFSNNEESSCQTLKKIQLIIDHVKGKFANTIHPGRNLCIDESLLLWKGRLRFKQYLPLKKKIDLE